MKLSRRRKSARRVRHTKRAGKKLRYKSKKLTCSITTPYNRLTKPELLTALV